MRLFFYFFLFLYFLNAGYSQTGIGTATPDPSAQLEVTSEEKGFLTPRMTKAQREAIIDPATGLLVYQTDVVDSTGFYYYDGSDWMYLSPDTDEDDSEFEGFSAFISGQIVSGSQALMDWGVTSPYYGSPGFNSTTGVYTIPQTGKYRISATINYKVISPTAVNLSSAFNPYFEVQNISLGNLISGYLPILDVNSPLISIRSILASGQVVLTGDVELLIGDEIGLFYEAEGMAIPFELGGSGPGVTWSVQKID